jgi:soluble lytic murein transglycosylase-like protein
MRRYVAHRRTARRVTGLAAAAYNAGPSRVSTGLAAKRAEAERYPGYFAAAYRSMPSAFCANLILKLID